MEPKAWTPDELVKLRNLYGTNSDRWLSFHFDTSEAEIVKKAAELTLGKDKRSFKGLPMPRWSKTDLKILRNLHPTTSNHEVARQLGRSVKSVMSMAFRLGLHKDQKRLKEMGRDNVALRRGRQTSEKGQM